MHRLTKQEQFMEIIKSTWASGKDVLISRFDKFCVVKKISEKAETRQREMT